MTSLSGSQWMIDELLRATAPKLEPWRNPLFPSARFGGIDVHASHLFPYESTCSKCGGTGDGGEESTYCQRCGGGGGHTVHGVMTGVEMCVIQSSKPPRFPVRWPDSIPVPKRALPTPTEQAPD